MKGQAISMDFIMTFVVYLFALSIFFYGIKETIDEKSFDVDAEFVLDKISQLYVKGVKVQELQAKELYQDLGADACIFIKRGDNVVDDFATYEKTNPNKVNPAYFKVGSNEVECGVSTTSFSGKPQCRTKNSILLTKPVLYKTNLMTNYEIATLGVLLCK